MVLALVLYFDQQTGITILIQNSLANKWTTFVSLLYIEHRTCFVLPCITGKLQMFKIKNTDVCILPEILCSRFIICSLLYNSNDLIYLEIGTWHTPLRVFPLHISHS